MYKDSKVEKAADLLLNTSFQISDISEKVGFNSFAYFTKSFKEYYGVTPSQYKNNFYKK
ncbi:MAG: helix-turn-helix transcriptional regulator [Chloroflexia bacterium]|nr:helix-turn-helix transcriptional regulator [Chloroflexia bacterium]